MDDSIKNTSRKSGASTLGFYHLVLWIFVGSMLALCGITVFAVANDSLNTMITVSGMIYMILSVGFLSVMAWAFISGHLGGARDIEKPKMQIFQLEDGIDLHTPTPVKVERTIK